MVMSSMNEEQWLRGIIYFVGVFGSLWTSWEVSSHTWNWDEFGIFHLTDSIFCFIYSNLCNMSRGI